MTRQQGMGDDSQAAVLYAGKVMHQRMKPFGHRFEYSVFSMLIDVDQLPEASRLSRLFSVDRFNICSFFQTDHIDPRISPVSKGIRVYVDALFETAGAVRPARVQLFAYPRIFGHVFNPIALYYAYDEAGNLSGMIYEVRNTFGERHTYVCPVEQGEMSIAGLRQSQDKHFHVSPFIDMKARYDFRLTPPSETLNFRILERDDEGPLLAATFAGTAKPFTTGNLISQMLRIPFLGLKIVLGIHFEALRLWLKGAKFRRSPPPP
ncbi:MAG: DUF1365 domain-containing protein, partial [Rhizobiaceae bacterium]